MLNGSFAVGSPVQWMPAVGRFEPVFVGLAWPPPKPVDSVALGALKASGANSPCSHGVRDVLVPEVVLERPGSMAVIGELNAGGVA